MSEPREIVVTDEMIEVAGLAAFQWLQGFTVESISPGLAEDLAEECLKAGATAANASLQTK